MIAVVLMTAMLLAGAVSGLAWADEAKPVDLSDSTWAELRSESAELQVLEERFQRLTAQAELTRQAFWAKRAVLQGKVTAARERGGVVAECLPDPVKKTWARIDGSDASCLNPTTKVGVRK